MTDLTMGAVEARFARIIWDNEPITAAQLAKLAEAELKWKKTTSYTALKRLCGKGIFHNDGGTVTSILSREEFHARQGQRFLDDAFEGSLPAFIAAFTQKGSISKEDLDAIRQMLDNYEQEGRVWP